MTRQNIQKVLKYCCKQLDLPIPKIKIEDEGFWLASFRYQTDGKVELSFNTERMTRTTKKMAYDAIWKYMNYKPKFKWEYSFYVIAHELGHYLQYDRHTKWLFCYEPQVEKYIQSYKRFSLKEYHSLKLEANANKIALILLKRAKRAGFRLDT